MIPIATLALVVASAGCGSSERADNASFRSLNDDLSVSVCEEEGLITFLMSAELYQRMEDLNLERGDPLFVEVDPETRDLVDVEPTLLAFEVVESESPIPC